MTLLQWTQVILSGLATLILVPLGIYFVRYYWDRRRWHAFEALIRAWAREEQFDLDSLSGDLTSDEWNALVATKLSEAGFEPEKVAVHSLRSEIQRLMTRTTIR